ncbi:MAG: MBL fold metallo-hydrolase [Candidatus Ozemobacteraceae bacterium]
MKIFCLAKQPKTYSGRVYLVLGTWNRIEDVNTLVDVGTDGSVIEEVAQISTGVGKKPVQQVVITHNHFDHSGGLPLIIERYSPEVLSFGAVKGITRQLKDGEEIKLGDEWFQILHFPGHSQDSICLYNQSEGVLFSGDTQLVIRSPGGTYERDFVEHLSSLASMKISTIYSGHDDPITGDIHSLLLETLRNIR